MSVMKISALYVIYNVSLSAMFLEDLFCVSRNVRKGGGGLVYPEDENRIPMSELAMKIHQ